MRAFVVSVDTIRPRVRDRCYLISLVDVDGFEFATAVDILENVPDR